MRLILSLILLVPLGLSAQDLPPPTSVAINSDYGPRNNPGYGYHWGLDYDGTRWSPIYAVSGGTIAAIVAIENKAKTQWIWHLDVQSAPNQYWYYMHIFENISPAVLASTPSAHGNYELRIARLVNPNNPNDHVDAPAIIFWISKANNRAGKIFSAEEGGWLVQTGISTAPYVLSASGTNLLTTNTVGRGDLIAPMGNSGVTYTPPADGSHLHLAASSYYPAIWPVYYDINPLYYVQHATPSYTVSIPSPEAGTMLFRIPGLADSQQAAERVRVKVVSGGTSNTGNDLDRVKLYLFPRDGSWTEPIFDSSRLVATISYGGLPPTAADDKVPYPSYITTSSGAYNKTGVAPVGGMGEEDFYFAGLNTKLKPDGKTEALLSHEAKFPDGDYQMAARAHSIRHNDQEYIGGMAWLGVGVDNFRPYVEQVTVTRGTDTVYDRKWSLSAGEGKLTSIKPDAEEFLVNGQSCDILATFSEYMDEASVSGVVSDLDDNHTIHKSTLATTLEITGYTVDALRPLEFKGKDVAGNYILTISPNKPHITPSMELTRGPDGNMQGTGGSDSTDTFHALRIEAGPPVIEYQGRAQIFSNTCSGACGTDEEPINLVWNLVRFRYKDIGAGIQNVTIQKKTDAGLELVRTISYDRHIYEQDLELTLGDGQYVATLTDYSGNPYKTIFHFRVDPDSPRLELLGLNMSGDFTNYTAYGVVQDTASGMDFLRLHNTDALVKDFAIADDGRESFSFTSPALAVGRENYYVFSAQDKAGNGSYPQPILQFDTLQPGEVGPGQTNLMANYITGVYASGEPCTINITSQRYNSPIPISYTLPQGDSITASLSAASMEPVRVATPDKFIHGNVAIDVPEQVCQVINGENVCRDACAVSLTGRSIVPLANGPALSYNRNHSAPDNGVKFRFGWYEITFFDLAAAAADKLIIENVGSQAKPDGYVAYPLGTTGALRIKYEGATYSAIEFKVCGMTGAAAQMKVLHYKDNGESEQLPNLSQGDCVTARSPTNSIFSVIAPIGMFDKLGPRVDVEAEHIFADNGILYVSSASPVALKSSDLSADMVNALAGVATTYYLLGIEPTPDCLGTTYEPAAAPGTCQNPVYGGQFAVREGLQNLYYRAVDKAGNIGDPWVTLLGVDGTAPKAEVRLNGVPIAGGATVYATTADTFTLSAFDIESNGVMSGLATTYFMVDISTEECTYSEDTGGVNGMGSCENPFYTGPFNLPEGAHTIYYFAVDNVGNEELPHTLSFFVGEAPNTVVACGGTVVRNTVLSGDLNCPDFTGVVLKLAADNIVLDGRGYKINAPNASVVLSGGSRNGVTIRNLDLSGAPGTYKGKGLQYTYAKNLLIENVKAHNREVGLEAVPSIVDAVIRNNDLSGNRTALQTGGSTITVSGNNLSNSLIGLNAGGSNLLLAGGNDFHGSTTAVWLNNLTDSVIENLTLDNRLAIGGGSSKRLTFRNLDLSGAGGVGLEFGYTEHSVYENITVHGRDTGLKISAQNRNSVIRNNNLSGNGIALEVNGSTMTVSGNVLANSLIGLLASGSNLLLANDNNFSGSTTAVQLPNCSDSVLEGLTLDNRSGLVVTGGKNLIIRNMNLSGPAGGRTGLGLRVYNTRDSLIENITAHNRDYGIESRVTNSGNVFRANNLTGNRVGLAFNGSSITVSGNQLGNNEVGLDGDTASGFDLRVDNDFSGSTMAVYMAKCSDGVLEGLTLPNPTGVIVTGGKNLTIRNMNLSGPAGGRAGLGLRVYNTKDSLIENITAHNRDYGIESRVTNSGNVFRANNLTGNRIGLAFNGSSITVSGNQLGNNEVGLEGDNASGFDLRADNGFAGSTVAVYMANCSSGVLEGLTLPNPTGLVVSGGKNLVVRNMNLSGPAGGRTGLGLDVYSSQNFTVAGVLAANRAVAVNLKENCPGARVVNVTLANNATGLQIAASSGGAAVYNSVFWGNADDVLDRSATAAVAYSDIQEALLPGEGNIRLDPQFVDAAAGDFRLRQGSPCLEAGSNSAAGQLLTDLAGQPRLHDADSDGLAMVDMGAYESQAVLLPAIMSVSPASGTVSSGFTLAGVAFGPYAAATSKVLLGTAAADVVGWTNTSVQASVPATVLPGEYTVVIERELNGSQVLSSTAGFTVLPVVSASGDGAVTVVTPGTPLAVTAVSTATVNPSEPLFSAMSGAGLQPAMDAFYHFEPSGVEFPAPAQLRFVFDPVLADTSTVSIYYFDGLQWSSAPVLNQTVGILPDGLAYVEGYITHTSVYAALSFTDTAPPVTSAVLSGLAGENGWYVSPVALSLVSTDAVSGVAATYYGLSREGVLVSSGIYGAALVAGEEGHYSYSYRSQDNAGNSEAENHGSFKIDLTPPAAAVLVNGALLADGATAYLTAVASVTLTASDPEVNASSSGLAAVYYRVTGGGYAGVEAVYGGTFSLAKGTYTVCYRAEDNAGNIAAEKCVFLEPAPAAAGVALKLTPEVLNLRSGEGHMTAVLVSSEGALLSRAGVRVSAVNDSALAAPIYAISAVCDRGGDDNEGRDGKERDDDDGSLSDDDDHGCSTITAKFERKALAAILPADETSKITVSGSLADGSAFEAHEYLRAVEPRRVTRKDGGKHRHHGGACLDAPPGAVKEDLEITIVQDGRGDGPQENARAKSAADKGLRLLGAAWEFGPEGTAFDKAVTISLPYEPSGSGRETPALAYWNAARGQWEQVDSWLDEAQKLVTARVNRLAVYQVIAGVPGGRARASAVPSGGEGGYTVLAGPDAAFRLGEVYVFPNPAKGGADPVFHIEAGIADRVKITVYTVSGRPAHEVTLTAPPAALDDGNGLSYAYEYAWRGRIPSGVYYYHVEAEKNGQKLKKSGKFAVVR